MIKITIELISAISPTRNKILGVIEIVNQDTVNKLGHPNYSISLSKWEPKLKEIWKKGIVLGFNNIKRGPYDLLYLGLKACLGNRNGEHKSLDQLEKENETSI